MKQVKELARETWGKVALSQPIALSEIDIFNKLSGADFASAGRLNSLDHDAAVLTGNNKPLPAD